MKRYTDLDLYGSLSFQLDKEYASSGTVTGVSVDFSSFLRFTGNDPVINGIESGESFNRIVLLTFSGTGSLTLKHESNTEPASNRILSKNGDDLILEPNDGILLFYNSFISRWSALSHQNYSGSYTINQSSGFNNFSDGRINLSSTVSLQSSGNQIMDASSTSFVRKTGGECLFTINNMSEGQTVQVLFESTGSSYTITWSPSIKWLHGSVSGNNSAPTPTSNSNHYDLYKIQKIGGMYFGEMKTFV